MNRGAKILIIDDEKSIRRFLEISLDAQGYKLFLAKTGKDGLEMFNNNHPDVVILDLELPDIPGQTVLSNIRAQSAVPVIILTVSNTDKEKENLLDAGADDYLTKPFSMTELLARIRVALRHAVNLKESPVYSNGPLEINFNTRVVKVNTLLVELTPTEFNLLKVLVKYEGKIITQSQLLKEVWGPHAVQQAHYVRIYVSQLRRKLENNTGIKGLIGTEQGVGYRLTIF
ncbi:MAG: response regulator transcription factor [Candidatus Margulisbacteria bacterium]|nr:response regulator transcription factor [Candidatus Margulisiibacteriota bacterium]